MGMKNKYKRDIGESGLSKGNKFMEVKPAIETFAKIKVVGLGGSGGSAINRMISSKIKGVEFVVINTDAQALHHNQATTKIQIGKTTTRGLGAGMDSELGRKAAEENQDEIYDNLKGSDMVFLTCGLGGGTGTGSAPVVADIAKDVGALTVAVVTKPFSFEGEERKRIAESGLSQLIEKVDTIITIPNDRLLQIIDKKTSLLEAFSIVDDILQQGVQGISELITVPGLVNVDFADVKAIMQNAGSALMGIGRGSGENRAVEAAKMAIESPLLEMSIEGAKGILFTVTGGSNLGMYELNEAAKIITNSADPNAKIIFGSVIDENLKDEIKITVIATGFGEKKAKKVKSELATPFSREEKTSPAFAPVSRSAAQPVRDQRQFRERVAKDDDLAPPPKTKEEEELDIPAFIRKKMM